MAKLGRRSALPPGGDRDAGHARRARRGRPACRRAPPIGARLGLGPFVHRDRAHRRGDGRAASASTGSSRADAATGLVKVEAGIVLADLNRGLDRFGLAFENLGDIDRQTLAGSISTGTHGTGERFTSISAQVEAIEMVLADGSVLEMSADDDEEALDAARIGLGALGMIYAVTIRTVPAFRIDRLDNPKPLEETLARLDELNRDQRPLRVLRVPTHRRRAVPREPADRRPPRPRHRAAVYAQEVMVENWVGGLFALAGRRLPSRAPLLARIASAGTGRSHKLDKQLPGVRQRAPGQVHRDGVRDPARARPRGRPQGARDRRAARARGRVSDRGPVRGRR